MGGNLAASDNGNQVLEVGDFLVGKLVQQAGNMGFQCAAVFQRLVAQDVEHLRINHRRNEIECHIRVGHDTEQRRLAVANLFKFQFVALHQFPHLPDVKGSHSCAAANQDRFCCFACCLLSRTF